MPAMLMPAVNSYFAIYTLEGQPPAAAIRGPSWDLHATATDRKLAISHARMLALQPGVREVHVKQVIEDLASGLVRVKDIMRCRRDNSARLVIALAAAAVIISAFFLLF